MFSCLPATSCMDKHSTVKGRDLAAPVESITLGGVTYRLRFDNRAARTAEDVYEDIYNRPDKGYYDILGEAQQGKHRALQALYYGALIAGGATMSWEEFDRSFTLGSIDGMEEIILAALSKSLPPADESAPNADSQPQTQDDGPGAG